jgi:SET domain
LIGDSPLMLAASAFSLFFQYGYLPLPPRDYREADKILTKALDLSLRNPKLTWSDEESSANNATSLSERLWNDLHSLICGMRGPYETSRILNAIPPKADEVLAVMESGGTAKQHLNRSIKELEWLEQNGQCMDNIKAGNSTNPDAGRGAFANRFIPEGGLVSPSPVIHIANAEMLKMWLKQTQNEKGEIVPDMEGGSTYQLFINYCFAHSQSTLLLCPYGLLTSLINHSSEAPNAKIVWSNTMRHKEWLEQPIKEWGQEYHTGLQLDFVATRDIKENEEIFIDYGDAWQTAWEKHVEEFVPPPEEYMPAYEMNDWLDQLGDLRTIQDRAYELDGVRMYCRWWYLRQGGIKKRKDDDDPPCQILKKLNENKDGGDSYLVELLIWTDSHNQSEYKQGHEQRGRLVWGLPKDAFYFADLPYTRDMHQEWAFRHPMMIPDEIFPDVWRNGKNGEDRWGPASQKHRSYAAES